MIDKKHKIHFHNRTGDDLRKMSVTRVLIVVSAIGRINNLLANLFALTRGLSLSMVFILMFLSTACSSSTAISGFEHLSCSSDVRLNEHNVICERASPQDLISTCSLSGEIENIGSGDAVQVLVQVEYGKPFRGVRSTTFNFIGDLPGGDTATFTNGTLVMNPDSKAEDAVSVTIVTLQKWEGRAMKALKLLSLEGLLLWS